MKVFDHLSFLGSCATAFQAVEIAAIADGVLERASFVLYGEFDGERYLNFSSYQKAGDTHALLAYAPKRMG